MHGHETFSRKVASKSVRAGSRFLEGKSWPIWMKITSLWREKNGASFDILDSARGVPEVLPQCEIHKHKEKGQTLTVHAANLGLTCS